MTFSWGGALSVFPPTDMYFFCISYMIIYGMVYVIRNFAQVTAVREERLRISGCKLISEVISYHRQQNCRRPRYVVGDVYCSDFYGCCITLLVDFKEVVADLLGEQFPLGIPELLFPSVFS